MLKRFRNRQSFVCAFFLAACTAYAYVSAAEPTTPGPASPLSPDDSLKHLVVADGLKVELVAAEPEVIDPVALRFDEDGRLWVVEMRDYPHPPEEGQPPKSRIRLLEDRDGDGRYETSTVFADELLFATGLQPWKGGVIVTISGKIVYMKDTDGDGRADVQEVWFTGFTEQNPQLRVNHPRFALDNHIYVASGMRGGMVLAAREPKAEPVSLQNRDLRFDPFKTVAEAVTGTGQFGVTFDDFGNRFVVSNRNPCIHLVLADRYLHRNKFLTLNAMQQDVAAAGDLSHIYSLASQWTTSILHAGQFTAACGVDIYRGDALPPSFYGNSFTCEPTGNLVHRETIQPNGASFVGKPAYEGREFLASTDSWFRPVNVDGGPDGALYVMDMYRAVIEHPQFMPAELKERPDVRYGDDRGRIYRVVPAEFAKKPKPQLSKATTAELVKLLEHPNAWWRETAQRLIYERQDVSVVSALGELAKSGSTPIARSHALWALKGLRSLQQPTIVAALGDTHPRVREQAIVLAEPIGKASSDIRTAVLKLAKDDDARLRFQVVLSIGDLEGSEVSEALASIALAGSDDVWTRRAVATATPENVTAALTKVIDQLALQAAPVESELLLVEELARISGARRDVPSLLTMFAAIDPNRAKPVAESVALAAVNGIAQGMRSGKPSLADFAKEQSKVDPDGPSRVVEHWFARAGDVAGDTARDEHSRKDACDLLAFAPYDLSSSTLLKLLDNDKSQDIKRRALSALAAQRDKRVPVALLERFPSLTPSLRSSMLDAMMTDSTRLGLLLDEIEAKRIKPAELGPLRVTRIVQHKDKNLQARAKELLASAIPADREKALADYQTVLALKADPRHGKEVFRKNCSTCHKIGDVGVDVGPSIADLRTKTPDQLLVDILQPSKAIDNNFMSYSVTTTDGQGYTGIIVAETEGSVTFKLPEAKTVALLRTDIDELRSNGISLMPDGLEKNVTKQDMADVIGFLKNWRYIDSGVPAATSTSAQ
jgi:putative membrane-bound dehydrogenase-like protein